MWLITYLKVPDENAQRFTEIVNAPTYTAAFLEFYLHSDFTIIDIKKI